MSRAVTVATVATRPADVLQDTELLLLRAWQVVQGYNGTDGLSGVNGTTGPAGTTGRDSLAGYH